MSELINNSEERKARLKELILKLHAGESEQIVRKELESTLSSIPYGEVVEVEQELISEGLPEQEVLKLCDAHSAVLHGKVDLSGFKDVPDGHPVDIMLRENKELRKTTAKARKVLEQIAADNQEKLPEHLLTLRGLFNNIYDVDKHYLRKEYLLFPFLEQEGITGPPKVMWGKHDEIRELIKGGIELLGERDVPKEELLAAADMVLKPSLNQVDDMTIKEEEILLPMSMDKLTEAHWHEISKQSLEIGFCLYDPPRLWQPEWAEESDVNEARSSESHIQLPSGSFTPEELLSILNNLPVDMTFVDKDDKVKYFSQSSERVFQRNRAILNRDVRHCHPPGSTHIVDKIIEDFRAGHQKRAPFWIQMGDKFIHIEYFALHNDKGEYLGTLEVSHDVERYRKLKGEQRILSYSS